MVLLTITTAAKKAIEEYCRLLQNPELDGAASKTPFLPDLTQAAVGDPIEHQVLIDVSKCLTGIERFANEERTLDSTKKYRLNALLKGATVYRPPPLPKPEPTPEYKALMKRLRAEEEQRQYERMINPPQTETFQQRFPNSSFGPISGAYGQSSPQEVDEVTYADVNRQMILIINVLVSIIACAVFIWVAARRWSVPSRLGLSMSGSGLVAFAEVAIYLGYVKRLKDAKQREVKKVEKKEVIETWVASNSPTTSTTLRQRRTHKE